MKALTIEPSQILLNNSETQLPVELCPWGMHSWGLLIPNDLSKVFVSLSPYFPHLPIFILIGRANFFMDET